MILGEGTRPKAIPTRGVVDGSAAVRVMMPGLDTGLVTGGACATAAGTEDGESAADKLTVGAGGDSTKEKLNVDDGLRTGEDVHAESVTVTVDNKRTVLTPSAPVDVKAEMPFGNSVGAEAGGEVGRLLELKLDDEEEVVGVTGERRGALLEGTIPPKLKVLVAEVELNWRLFSLMTDGGGAPGALRLMTGGVPDGCGAAA